MLGTYQQAKRLLEPAAVVLAGQVNVGKSTLANALTGCRQSLEAELPGTTRDYTVRLADCEGVPIHLIDTAGHRQTEDAIERVAIDRAAEQIVRADVVVLVVAPGDGLHGNLPVQLEDLRSKGVIDPLIVLNKSDLLSGEEPDIAGVEVLPVSAKTGDNLGRLRRAIVERLGLRSFDPQQPLVFTERQYCALRDICEQCRGGASAGVVADQLRQL